LGTRLRSSGLHKVSERTTTSVQRTEVSLSTMGQGRKKKKNSRKEEERGPNREEPVSPSVWGESC